LSEDTTKLLLAWTQDRLLAARSGYHIIADELPGEKITVPRQSPNTLWARLSTRCLRQFAFSNWCVQGSFEIDRQLRQRIQNGFRGIIHYLWCDRDFAFLHRYPKPPGLKLIGTFHQTAEQLNDIIRRPRGLTQFDAIVLMSHTQRQWFLHQGIAAEKLHVIHHGVDTAHFQPPPVEHGMTTATHPLRILSVGSTGRDFATLLSTVKLLQNSPEFHFQIIGPAWESQAFSAQPNVNYRSTISDAQLLHAYQSADCLLHLATAATANNVIMEALASGLAIVATDIGGIPEYLKTSSAFLVPVSDPEAAAQKLRQISADRQQLPELAQQARTHAQSFAWPKIAAQTQALYAKVMAA
jgi:glycosyltransferase involved in cell wall biosynthesis